MLNQQCRCHNPDGKRKAMVRLLDLEKKPEANASGFVLNHF
jgi:hypothetical protein